MLKKLEYLKKYNREIQIIDTDQLLTFSEKIPSGWLNAIEETEFSLKLSKTIALWEDAVGMELRNTILYLRSHLVSLDILYDGESLALLYGIKSKKGDILYYEGKLPPPCEENKKFVELTKDSNNIPSSLNRFYAQLHNGFYYYASHSMGLLPSEEIVFLGEYDWDIVEKINEPLQLDMNNSFGFFTNGIGAYVVVDISEYNKKQATLWFKNKTPKYNLEFWDIVDEWMVLGFSG